MKPFKHKNAQSVADAVDALGQGARAIAGGTDILATIKDNILPIHPETVVNLKTIPGLEYIKTDDGALTIGALTKLVDIAESADIQSGWSALAQAAKAVATPNIRNMGTIGGSISQLPRCWYFRKADNRFNCHRKGGDECFAILGDNRYHSAFGGSRCHATPCKSECPAATDIPRYMEQIRAGNWDRAAEIIMEVNPIPMTTGRVCAHFCQNKCNRRNTDETVAINNVERALGDYILENSDRFYAAPKTETGKSVAIIGSGPAGLSAAFYLRREGSRVTVFDTQEEAGGMLMYAIPAYRLPKDVVRKIIAALTKMGIEFKTGVKLGETVSPEEIERQYDAVCYATGTWKRPVLGLSGEDMTVFGLEFLTEVRRWFSDNKLSGREVFVMGGGNVAMDVAVTAKRLGASKVTLACLEPRERMPASGEEIARAEEEGVVIMPSWGLSKVVERDGKPCGMELVRCVSPWDDTGRFNPQYDQSVKVVIESENLLMATGQQVDLSFLDEKYQLQLTARGLIDVDDKAQTSRPGVFAAGDAAMGPGTVIRAIDLGHKAARGILRHLGVAETRSDTTQNAFLTNDIEGLLVTTGLRLDEIDASKRALEVEDTISPTRELAAAETRRCLDCGCYAVSPSDVATALVALDAVVVTSRRELAAAEFFQTNTLSGTCMDGDEIVTHIRVPALKSGAKSVFKKFALRKSIDFPVINCAVVTGSDARVALGAMAPTPFRAHSAEKLLSGAAIDEALAENVGTAAVSGAAPYEDTKYKVQIAKTMIKRALLELK
ncbi:MAG: FAD-dependent oxidoreductase [Oscillospiraceae bacterium]|jgi:NADPH-dependent glutamate synthase beta subunit-like oxidoreductase/CO/xanthine dehydrogenase FAD-binding subunit|nr:FAD-dependent oxidoreductase [Oscillospiraceae bacterium]